MYQSSGFQNYFNRGISITAQKAVTLLLQTAETAFKDQKCHFIMTAFIYLSIKIFFKKTSTAHSHVLSNIPPWSSVLDLVILSSAFLHLSLYFFYYAVALQVVRLWVQVGWKPAKCRMLQAWGEELLWQIPACSLGATALIEMIFAQCPSEVLQTRRECGEISGHFDEAPWFP